MLNATKGDIVVGLTMCRLVSWAMVVTLLMNVFVLAFFVHPVRAAGTIYIGPDGSIYPPTASLFSVDNVTYTFTDNIINNSIVVLRNNIIIDGAGYTLQGIEDYGGERGIYLTSRSNVTIKNTTIRNFDHGILLCRSSNNSICGNNITANNGQGILLDFSSDNTICGNNVMANNGDGIVLDSFSNNTICRNNITNNREGIHLWSSSNNSIYGNNITANDWTGIWLEFYSNHNSISGNNITNNWCGIHLYRSSNYNNISGNSITNNDDGIFLHSSSNNSIYHNNFVDNTMQVESSASPNFWDSGYPSGGNYWSDYSGADFYNGPYQNETGSDGIGDTPYIIDENNTDHYPLMSPYVIPEFPSLLILPLLMTAILLAVVAHRKKRISI